MKTNIQDKKETKYATRNKIVLAVLTIAIVAVVAAFAIMPHKQMIAQLPTSVFPNDSYDANPIASLNSFQRGTYTGPLINELPAAVFSKIPAKPDEFNVITTLINTGQITETDFCTKIDSSYWLQPDFYPNNGAFYDLYKNPMRDADGTLRRGVYGYGTYISELTSSVNPGSNFSACVYIHSSWYIWTFQSLAFAAEYPETSSFTLAQFPDGTKKVTQLTSIGNYFNVEINPPYVLLEPSYPYLFEHWASKITVNIRVAQDTPKGRYMLAITPTGKVPTEIDNEWFWKYKTNYVKSSGFYQNILMMGIDVV